MGVLRTDAWNELNVGPVVACSCMPGVRVFIPRAARSFSRKVPKLRLMKQKTIRATSLLCCMQHAVLSWDRSTVLGNGISMIFWGTERAIKPENERFQLRTLGTGWSMKKICFGTAGNEKDMLWNGWQGVKRGSYLYCHYTWVPPPPGGWNLWSLMSYQSIPKCLFD